MEFLQGYIAAALWALVFSCIIAKLVSSAVSSDENTRNQVGTKGVREIDAENSDIAMADEDEGELFVEKAQIAEQCCDATESKNIGFLEGGAIEEKAGASKIESLCGVEGKDVLGDVKVVGEKNVVESKLVRDDAAGGHIEGGLRQEDDEKDVSDDDDDDDDWEGIERSELEILFGKAINFVECGKNDALSNLGNELQMQLYGLQKMAMEGPCHEPQPMAFNFPARAKWNAWQRMGRSMSSEVAMEQYIKLLSDTLPGWIICSSTGSCVNSSSAIGKTGDQDLYTSSLDIQSDCTNEK